MLNKAEILLKVALNQIKLNHSVLFVWYFTFTFGISIHHTFRLMPFHAYKHALTSISFYLLNPYIKSTVLSLIQILKTEHCQS
jgi:hypothetical protein